MGKKIIYVINKSRLDKISEAIDEMIQDLGPYATIRNIDFEQESDELGLSLSTKLEIAVKVQ